ncbi:MAG TPA: hypothetical protein VMV94_21185 [Phycisphaerae bacterium]|nr:hypothetical protein [Phycisphaerae bacterium]
MDLKRAESVLKTARDLLDRGHVSAAIGKFRYTISIANLEGPGREAYDQLLALHETAMSRLVEATNLYGRGEYAKAMDLALEVRTNYANLLVRLRVASQYPDPARLADGLVTQIRQDRHAQPALRERSAAQAYMKVRRSWLKAQDDPTLYLDVSRGLKSIARRFADTPTGEKCQQQVSDLLADEKIRSLIEREEQRRFIASALESSDQYQRFGLIEEAEAERAKLTDHFPGKSLEELSEMARKQL